MKNLKINILIILFIVFGTINMLAQKYEVPKIEQYKLSNGLTVILCEDHTSPQAFGTVVVRAGTVNDPSEATGLAHYLEHMIFKGTQNLGTIDWEKEKPYYEKVIALYDELGKTKDKKQREAIQKQINETSIEQAKYVVPNEYNKLLSEIGAVGINAGTGYDMTKYLSYFPSAQIEKWLTLYSNSFQNPVFRGFQAELETVYEEFNMYKDRSSERIREEVMKNIFSSSSYGVPLIGFGEHLKNPSLNKLIEFYNKYYVPNNMALVISGDFNCVDVKPYIEKTFGKLQSKSIPAQPEIKEAPFKGRKEVVLKLAPTESVQLVFRTVPEKHSDTEILKICSVLLRNGQTGFLDQLLTDGILTSVGASNSSLRGAGVMILSATPNPRAFYTGGVVSDYKSYMRELDRARIIGIEESEKKLIEALQRLTDGLFTDQMLDGVKKMMINSYITQLESNRNKVEALADLFVNDLDVSEFLNFADRINAITKNDVMRVAKQYFGKDYYAFIIKQGKAKPEKLEKPAIKLLEFTAVGSSAFASELRSMKSPEPIIHYVDFNKDVQKLQLKNGDNFYYSKNPVNDIFSFVIRFDIGTGTMKELKYTTLMNYAGAGGFNAQSIKAQFNNYNCNYSIYANDSYVTISLSGPEKNFKQAANLISLIINRPIIQENIVSSIMERENTGRRYEKSEPAAISDALVEYVMYGDKSPYLDRMTLKALNEIKGEELTTAFKIACGYSATVFCTGSWASAEQAKSLFESSVQLADKPTKGNAPFVRQKSNITENTIYFVHSSDAKQSQIELLANEPPYQISQDPIITGFNFYFSGGFNGLMQQEIREKRSMAYHSEASYVRAAMPGKDSYLSGNMSTQDDKTNGAIDVFWGLLRDMPQYPERISSIKEYLVWSAVVQSPNFRSLGSYVERSMRLGYTEDPTKSNIKAYESLTFDDIVKFWTENVKNKPVAFTIVGDKGRINLKELAKYGKVVEINSSALFSKDE